MKAKEILNIEGFNPLSVDVSFLKNVSAEIPEEGYMDLAMAERLAGATLKAAELCDDLLGQAVLLLSDRDAHRRATKSRVISELLNRKVPSTIVKELYADDPDYIKISNEYNIALAWHSWLENKHGTLVKTHHWCKDFVRKAQGSYEASGWESSNSEKSLRSKLDSSDEEVRQTSKSTWNV